MQTQHFLFNSVVMILGLTIYLSIPTGKYFQFCFLVEEQFVSVKKSPLVMSPTGRNAEHVWGS